MTTPLIWPTAAQAMANATQTTVAPLAWDPAALLLGRFGFGVTPADRTYLATNSVDQWWAKQVAWAKVRPGYTGVAAVAASSPQLAMRPNELQQWLVRQGRPYGWDAMDQLCEATIGLQAWSPAQLFESVVDFFSNHFNVPNHNGDVWNTRHVLDRDVIRRNAMGTFTNMLLGVARDPSMLTYLSNSASTVDGLNENYGRELLELHTVGISAGYTQAMVVDSARMLTGRTVDGFSDYVYDNSEHSFGPAAILGYTNVNKAGTDGSANGDAYLKYLATHPATAQHLAQKLCVRYVSDTPSDALVAAVAASYLANNTSIPATLYTIVCSTEFWSSRGLKVRRPTENILAALRTLGTTAQSMPDALNSLHWMTAAVGNLPLEYFAPNGYPAVAASWRSSGTLLSLWGYHRGLSQNWYTGMTTPDLTTLYGKVAPATSGQAIDLLCTRLTGQTFTDDHKALLQTFLGEPASTLMGRSMLRWWLSLVVPLILDSPYFALS